MQTLNLDTIDYKILGELQREARISNVDLAERVNLSPSPCLARVRRLEREGFIRRYTAILDSTSVGLKVNVFVQVRLEKQIETYIKAFEKVILERPEVLSCFLMTGSSDYLLHIVVADLQDFQKFVTEVLARIPGVGSIQSSIALKEVKFSTALPLNSDRPYPKTARRAD